MKPPNKSCGDISRWQRTIQVIFQELGSRTPRELLEVFSSGHDVHVDELNKHRLQELFANYMTQRLGIEFKYTTPTDLYPKIYVQLVVGLHDSHVRLELHLPRSVADFIKHEGAMRETTKRNFEFNTLEAKLFEAGCRAQGKDPAAEWDRIKAEILGNEDIHVAILSHEGKLHYHGLYVDELADTMKGFS